MAAIVAEPAVKAESGMADSDVVIFRLPRNAPCVWRHRTGQHLAETLAGAQARITADETDDAVTQPTEAVCAGNLVGPGGEIARREGEQLHARAKIHRAQE